MGSYRSMAGCMEDLRSILRGDYNGAWYLLLAAFIITKGVDAIVSEINKTTRIIIPIVAIMALGVYLMRDIAISLLFTEAFRSARDLLPFN